MKRLCWIVAVAACGGGGEEKAGATFEGINGQTIAGDGLFLVDGSKITFEVEMTSAPPGVHGMHIHQTPRIENGFTRREG